jgi:hypothetical protein
MTMKVVIEGDFGTFPRVMRAGVSKVVRKTALQIEADIKLSIQEPKSGRIYGSHQASAPGEAPATDTGLLVNSTQFKMVNELTAEVNINAEYGPDLEYGSTTMAARPFIGPAIEKERKNFNDDLSKLGRVS